MTTPTTSPELPAWLPAADAPPRRAGALDATAARIATAVARRLSDAAPGGARATVARLVSIDVEAALRQWAGRCIAAPVNASGGAPVAILAFDIAFALVLVDLALGGEGKEADLPPRRTLTKIESAILATHAGIVATGLGDVLVPEQGTAIGAFEARPETLRTFEPDTKAELLRLALHLGGRTGACDLLLPADRLAAIAGNTGAPDAVGAAGPRWDDTPVRLRAVLEDDSLPLGSVAALRLGDVLTLDLRAGSPVRLYAGDRPIVAGTLGALGDRLGIRVGAAPSSPIEQ